MHGYQLRDAHSMKKGKAFEGRMFEFITALFEDTPLVVHNVSMLPHSADCMVELPLPNADARGGKRSLRILVEWKHYADGKVLSKHVQTLMDDSCRQGVDGGVLVYETLSDTDFEDGATTTNPTLMKKGLPQDMIVVCEPTKLHAAILTLLGRSQPTIHDDAYNACAAETFRLQASLVRKHHDLLSLLPEKRAYEAGISGIKAALLPLKRNAETGPLLEEKRPLLESLETFNESSIVGPKSKKSASS